jgi:Spy/CpxP family protein refolding chaperone
MRRARIEILLIGLTVVALSAGVVAGVLASRLPTSQPPVGPEQTPLAAELNLSPEQQAQMKEIWEGVRSHVHQSFDEAQKLQKQRDDALVAILSDQQKAQFEKISKDFAGRFDRISSDRDRSFREAVEKTKKLLNDEQRKKYDEILKNRVQPGPGRGYGTPGGGPPAPTPGAT